MIVFGSTAKVTNNATLSVTAPVGTTMLLVRFGQLANSAPTTSCTYAGAAMTKVAGSDLFNSLSYVVMFYILNPTPGTNNVVISTSEGVSSAVLFANCVSGCGEAPKVGTTATGASGSVSATLASAVGNLVVDVAAQAANGTLTPNGTLDDRSIVGGVFASGTSHQAGASSVTTTWTSSSGVVIMLLSACELQDNATGAPMGITPFLAH